MPRPTTKRTTLSHLPTLHFIFSSFCRPQTKRNCSWSSPAAIAHMLHKKRDLSAFFPFPRLWACTPKSEIKNDAQSEKQYWWKTEVMDGFWKRRGWDSNPRIHSRRSTVFETVPFNRSGTPPCGHNRRGQGHYTLFCRLRKERAQRNLTPPQKRPKMSAKRGGKCCLPKKQE